MRRFRRGRRAWRACKVVQAYPGDLASSGTVNGKKVQTELLFTEFVLAVKPMKKCRERFGIELTPCLDKGGLRDGKTKREKEIIDFSVC